MMRPIFLKFIFFWVFASLGALEAGAQFDEDLDLKTDPATLSLQKQLIHFSKKNRDQENHLDQTERKLGELDKLQHIKTKALEERYDGLRHLLQALQRAVRHGRAGILQSGKGYDDFIRSIIVMRSLVQFFAQSQKMLTRDLASLEDIRGGIVTERKKLAKGQETLKKQADEIEKLLKQRQALIRKEIDRRKRIEERVNRLAVQSQNIHDLMRNIAATPPKPAEKKAKKKLLPEKGMPPKVAQIPGKYAEKPVQGSIVSQFGQTNTDNPDGMGVVFETRAGSRVLCPLAGQVVFSGPFRRYQNIIIIKHPGNFLTLLAGLEKCDVDVGQKVESGEPLGVMVSGSKGKLYLELRHNSEFINPSKWLL